MARYRSNHNRPLHHPAAQIKTWVTSEVQTIGQAATGNHVIVASPVQSPRHGVTFVTASSRLRNCSLSVVCGLFSWGSIRSARVHLGTPPWYAPQRRLRQRQRPRRVSSGLHVLITDCCRGLRTTSRSSTLALHVKEQTSGVDRCAYTLVQNREQCQVV